MKTVIVSLAFWLLLVASSQAGIVERVIYTGDTPLASTCTVTQTGLMELTVSACSFTTTGQARIVAREKVSNLPNEIAAGRVQNMPDGKRVRGWFRDKDGNIIDKSKTHTRATPVALSITAGDTWVVYLLDGPGVTMDVVLQRWDDPRPANFIGFIVMPFTVPTGTTDLSTITIEVFTVKPDFPPPKGLFER